VNVIITPRWKWSIKQPIIAGRRRKRQLLSSLSNTEAENDMNTIEKHLEDVYRKIIEKLESKDENPENKKRILRTEDLFDEDPAQ